MRASEFITEISWSDATEDLTDSDEYIITRSALIGDIDHTDVYLYTGGSTRLFFFQENHQILSYVLLHDNELKGIRNRTNKKGMITALMTFIVRKQGIKLGIPNHDMLTKEGLSWISKMITYGGFNIHDQHGDKIDVDQLSTEWQYARNTNSHGPTSIIIECDGTYKHRIKTMMPIFGIIHHPLLD